MKAPEEYNHRPPLPPRRHQHRGLTMMMMGRGETPRGTIRGASDVLHRRPILPAPIESRWPNNHARPLTSVESGARSFTQRTTGTSNSSRSLPPGDAETLVLLEDFPDPFIPTTTIVSPQLSNSGSEMLSRLEQEHRIIQEQLQSRQNEAIGSGIQRDLEIIQRELVRREIQETMRSSQDQQHPLLSMMETLLTNPPPTPRFPTPRPMEDISLGNLDIQSGINGNPWVESSEDSESTISSTHDGPVSILDDYLNMPTFHTSFVESSQSLSDENAQDYDESYKMNKMAWKEQSIKKIFAPNVPFQSEQIRCSCSCSNSPDGELWSPENCICYQQLLLDQKHASYLTSYKQQRRPIR